MNKHIYRIVFNRVLGVPQVVSELVRRTQGGASASGGRRAATVNAVSFALWATLGFVVTVPAFAQVVADPNAPGNQRPTVLGSSGSAALINIQTPSAGGVSRNTYSRFDVDSHGAVLNNARTNATTQLAGQVPANPWLATGTAKIILNEVTGANPSHLNGYVEVAGDRAQVIIANPSGIACDGCGFINANRVTLTTGTPILSAAGLDGYRVTGGAVRVDGAGLDASQVDYTAILTRALQVNAGLWTKQLEVATGANRIDANGTPIASAPDSASTPTFAIDVSALGGMYANKIQLIGTERGVGVRNAGEIGAQAGELVVTIDGRLESTGNLQAQGTAQITASGGVANAGTLSATDELRLTTAGDLDNRDGTVKAARVAIEAQSLRNQGGTIAQTGGQAMVLQAGSLSNRAGTIGVAALAPGTGADAGSGAVSGATPPAPMGDGSGSVGSDGTSPGVPGVPVIPRADGVLHIAGLLDNDGGRLEAASGFDLSTDGDLVNDGGQLTLRRLTLTRGDLRNRGGTLAVDGVATIRAGTLANDAGALSVNGPLVLDTQQLSNRAGTILQLGSGATAIDVAGTFDNTDGTLASNASALDLASGTLVNTRGTLTHAGTAGFMLTTGDWQGADGTLATAGTAMISAGRVDHRGATLSATQLTLAADSVDNRGGTIATSALDADTLTVEHTFDNGDGGIVAADGDLTLTVDVLGNVGGTVQHAGTGTLALHAATLNGAHGTILSNGTLQMNGQTTDLTGATTTAEAVSVNAGTLVTAGGTLQALGGDPLQLTVRDVLDNRGGTLASNGTLSLMAASVRNQGGTLLAAGTDNTHVQVAGRFDNTQGIFRTAGATFVHAGTLINQAGSLQAASDATLVVSVDGQLVNDQGMLESNGAMALTTGALSNHGGTVQTGQAIIASVAGALDNNAGLIVAGGDLSLNAASLSNRDTLTTDPTAAAMGVHGAHVTLDATTLDNSRGQVRANEALVVTGETLGNAGGVLDGQGAVVVRGTTLDNTGGQITQRGDTDTLVVDVSQGLINGAGGVIGAEGDAQLHAGTFDNGSGTTFAQHDLLVTSDGGASNRQGGVLQAGGDLSLTAGGVFDNHGGQLDATRAATVAAAAVTNADGRLLGDKVSVTTPGALDNRGGTVGGRSGDVSLQAATIDNSASGTLVAQRDLTLTTSSLNNADGTAFGTHNLSFQNASGTLDNTSGQLGAGDTAWLELAQITNTNGRLQADTLWLTMPILTNDGGEVVGNTVHATVGALNGIGRLYGADWLDAHVTGVYTHLAGQRLESDGVLSLTVDGTLTNQGTLQSAGELDVTAGNLVNMNGATINGSNAAHNGLSNVTVSGTLDNQQGAALEGDTLTVTADRLTNTGDILGDAVTLSATTLTNGRDLGTVTAAVDYGEGFIGASSNLALYVGDLANLDGELYSGSDLTLAGGRTGQAAGTVLNNSGWIHAEGNLDITAQQITNQRRYIQTKDIALTPAEQAQNTTTTTLPIYRSDEIDPAALPPPGTPDVQILDARQIAALKAFCGGSGFGTPGTNGAQWCKGYQPDPNDPHTIFANDLQAVVKDTLVSVTVLDYATAAGVMTAGGDMSLTGAVINANSQLAAGRDLTILDPTTGQTGMGAVTNQSWVPTGTVKESVDQQIGIWEIDGSNHVWVLAGYDSWAPPTTNDLTVNLAAGSAPSWITYDAGPGLTASITAGGAVSVTAAEVTNTVIGGPTLGPLDGPASTSVAGATGVFATTTGHVAGVSGQTVGTTDTPLPGLVAPRNGMYTQHAEAAAPFLVTTSPRFATKATSSNYLLQSLGYDPSARHKRLGDGYYEQNLVMDQLLQLTGRRTLNGGDGLAQYEALMDHAAAQAQQLGLSLGAPLTSTQIASLSSDIVWLVDQEVDGQHVLVPVVYLSQATADRLSADGALIAGGTVDIQAAGALHNDGTITSDRGTSLSADTLINTGALRSGGGLGIAARKDVLNSGTLTAQSIAVQAGRDLINSGAVTAGGDALLMAGRDLTTNVAPIQAGGNLAMVAGHDLTATASTIHAGGNAQLVAGNDLTLAAQSHATRSETASHGESAVTYATSAINAGGSLVLQAGHDLTSDGGQLGAGNQLALTAGNDLTLNAVTDRRGTTDLDIDGHSVTNKSTSDETVRGTSLSGANGVTVIAGHDLTATAATVNSANGAVALGAGNDLTLNSAQENHSASVDTKRSSSGFLSSSSTHTHDSVSDSNAVGATINGNSVTLAAGHDLTAQAAQVTATRGIALSAGHDVNLSAGQSAHTEEHDYSKTSSSVINTSATRFGSIDPEQRGNKHTQSIEQTSSVGTLLSGDTVTVAAGHDLTATAAQVAATHDVVLAAGNNLTLAAGKDTYNETDTSSKSHTGLMNGGGLSVMIGNQSLGTTYVDKEVSYTGSLVGSTDGRVTMSAGNDVHITDGTVLSQTGTTIVGKNVTIDAAVGTSDITQTQKQSSAGIHVGLTGGAANVANSVAGSAQAAHQSSDKRVQALYAAQAAQALFSTGGGSGTSGAQAIGNAAQGNTQDISLRIGLGASSATSTQTTHDDTAYGSSIRSNGDVTIAATGGDLNVIGSQINGSNVTLAAANNLNLLSQAEQHSDKSDSHNSSGEVGFSIGQTTGIYLSVNAGQAQGHGNGTTHAESGIAAADTLTLISGNDTTIRGAQAKGNEVLADIGGNLNIASEQDTNDYAAHSVQAGLTLVYGFSGGGAGVSGSLAASKTKSDYASVNQVSGIGAGDGGFQIHVGGNTDLHGAEIASSADPSKNLLDTGTLSFSDIQNKASYSSESISAGGGVGTSGNKMGMGTGISGGIGVPQNGSESSTTHAGIAEGTIVTRNGDTDLTGLDRKPTLDDQALKQIFDAQKVQENQQVGALAGQVGMTAVGDIASYMARNATTEQEQKSWSDGGSNKVILHGLVGAATAALWGGNAAGGALGAAASEAASSAMQQYLVDNGYTPGTPAFNAMMQLGSAAVGGVGGGSGASTALDGEQYNRQLHPDEKDLAGRLAAESNGKYTAEQIEDALRMSGNRDLGESPQTGLLVNVDQPSAMYDVVGAKWLYQESPDGSQQFLLQQLPESISPDLASYIRGQTGGGRSTYSWTPEQQGLHTPQVPVVPWLAPLPDYLAINGNRLGLGGSVAVNLHSGQVYAGGSGGLALVPSASFAFGWIAPNLGLPSQERTLNTANFLDGAGISATFCRVLCVGVNHSYGGDTAFELGAGIKTPAMGPSGSTGVMKPVFTLPFTSGDGPVKAGK